MSPNNFVPWLSKARDQWEAAVRAWLVELGHSLSLGKVESITTIKERPWSAVHKVTFEAGTSYFKACGTGGKHEPELLFLMDKQAVPNIPGVQAIETNHHWLLMADAGEPLPEALPGLEQVKIFSEVLPHYAELQIASLSWVDQLLDIGLPDRRVDRLPALLAGVLSDDAIGPGQNAESLNRLRASARQRMPSLEQASAALGRSAYSAALDHGDLHRGNLMLGAGEYKLCDWGDSSVTHPFCTPLISLETVLSHIPENERLQWALYLRDAYLEPWESFASRQSLVADFEQALWVGHVVRTLTFIHMFRAADEAILNRWRPLIFERLEMWLDHHDLVDRDNGHWLQALSL